MDVATLTAAASSIPTSVLIERSVAAAQHTLAMDPNSIPLLPEVLQAAVTLAAGLPAAEQLVVTTAVAECRSRVTSALAVSRSAAVRTSFRPCNTPSPRRVPSQTPSTSRSTAVEPEMREVTAEMAALAAGLRARAKELSDALKADGDVVSRVGSAISHSAARTEHENARLRGLTASSPGRRGGVRGLGMVMALLDPRVLRMAAGALALVVLYVATVCVILTFPKP